MNFVQKARESVATYSIVGNEPMIELQQLLAVIIGNNATSEICGKLAQYGIDGIVDMTTQELEFSGLSHLEALRLHSAMLLANKLKNAKNAKEESYLIRSPEDAANYMMSEMKDLKQEHFVVLFLNTKNEVIHKQTIFIGSLNASIVHPREVFREAIKRSSNAIIALHNHPSGDPNPSVEDRHVTKKLVKTGEMIGIPILDHIIIGENSFVSLKEKGHI